MNLASIFHEVAKQYSKKIAIIESDGTISYEELSSDINRLAAGFREIGIEEDDKVALILPNSREFVACFLALLKINAVVCPLSVDSTPYELKKIFSNLEPCAIIALSEVYNRIVLNIPELMSNKIIILSDLNITVNSGAQIKILETLRRLYNTKFENQVANSNDSQTAVISYTYRGYGMPLGVVFAHKEYTEGVLTYIRETNVRDDERVLSILPLHHFYPLVGCVLAPLLCGASVIISRNFSPRAILKLIDIYKINRLTAVPSIYQLLYQLPITKDFAFNSVKCCISGGSFMPADLQKSILKKMSWHILQGYGLTECFVVTWNKAHDNLPGSLGRRFGAGVQIKIEHSGLQKNEREVGEIVVKSTSIMKGYYKMPEETQDVMYDGCVRTGDLGYIDKNGYLHYYGLKKNITKVGGNIVDLQEVKNILISHPGILDAHVYALEHTLWGHVVAAKIYTGKNVLSEYEITAFCKQKLSQFKVPRVIEFSLQELKK